MQNPPNPDTGLEDLIICILRGIVEHTEAHQGSIYLERHGSLWLAAHLDRELGLSAAPFPQSLRDRLPESLFDHCFQTGLVSNHDESEPWPDSLPAPQAWLCQPLYLFRQNIGVLFLRGENRATLQAGAVAHYFETAALRVTRTRETEALQRDRARLEDLVQERTHALEEAQQELVRKERLATLGQLIATVSHELRNPLGTVRGSVFLIANKLLGKDLGVERALDRAERNIVRCDRIIEDLLAYTRTHDLELEPVRIDRWLENTLEEYPFPHDVTVRLELNAGVEIEAEPERLRRCLVNLLNNACDAMKAGSSEEEDGSKRLTIATHLNQAGDRLEISVSDSGHGIPESELAQILEPLFSTKSFGVGLGLPTVVQVMEQHGGGLEIESVVEEGTTMTLWIPLDNSMRQAARKRRQVSKE